MRPLASLSRVAADAKGWLKRVGLMKSDDPSSSNPSRVVIAITLCALTCILAIQAPAYTGEFADTTEFVNEHSWLPWPSVWPAEHPLTSVIEDIFDECWHSQPAWKLPMLVNGLQKEAEECHITSYCSGCPDAGRTTRWGSPARQGIAAADPKYWGPGSVIWMGPPINKVLIIEDIGGAIKGPHRFDVCMEGAHHMCRKIGRRDTIYVPLHRVPPTSNWGRKPDDWEPPVWAEPPCDEEEL